METLHMAVFEMMDIMLQTTPCSLLILAFVINPDATL